MPGCKVCDVNGCQACHESLSLLYGRCVEKCPKMFFWSNGNCLQCHYSCENCISTASEDCISCADDSIREGHNCVPQCSQGKISNKSWVK